MSELIRHQARYTALSLLFTILLANLPTGQAAEPAPPTTPAGDPSEVQDRAVIRGQSQLELVQPAPAPAKQIDKSTVLQDQRTLSPIAPAQPAPSPGGTGPLPVVGGKGEPDFQFPWVVRMGGCGGVLVDPQWVLTAAHCVTPGIGFGKLIYARTDPYTGAVSTETRGPISEQRPNPGVYIHPNYNASMDQANDIALIKLEKPFTISPYIQTVGVPRDFRHAGMLGTLASIDHVRMLPPGQAATFRAPIPPDTFAPKFHVPASTTTTLASLCPGDSGSGFVTVENGRATVRGIASQGSISSDCKMPSGEATFTDVFAFRGWILQTMGKPDPFNSRVRWSGRTARGTMGLGCVNAYNMTLWGPLNVVGVEEGIACEANQTQTAICNLDSNQGNVGTMVPTLSGLTVRTTTSSGTDVKTIPASGRSASFFGLLPPGASREFTCQIATPFTAGTVTGLNAQVLSRGVEDNSIPEGTIEQPSPFDPTEEISAK